MRFVTLTFIWFLISAVFISCKGTSDATDSLTAITELGSIKTNESGVKFLELQNADSSHKIASITIEGLQSPFSIEGGVYPGTQGDCPKNQELGPRARCRIALQIESQDNAGALTQNVSISYVRNGQTFKQDLVLTVTVVSHDVGEISAHAIDFGDVKVRTTSTKDLMLTNNSSIETAILTDFKFDNAEFVVENEDKCQRIAPRTTCVVDVKFAPTTKKTSIANLEISYLLHGIKRTLNIKLTATTVITETGRPSISGYFLGKRIINKGDDAVVTVYLENPNPKDLFILGIDFALLSPFRIDQATSSCLHLVPAGKTCTLVFKASPVVDKIVDEMVSVRFRYDGRADSTTFTLRGEISVIPN